MSFTHREIKGKWYPRITYMLGQVNAKGKYFDNFLKSNGFNADKIAMDAADSGTRVHKACELLQTKGSISPSALSLNEKEYKKVMGFVNWTREMKVDFKDAEVVVNDDQCCGRFDIVCEIGGESWVVDIKSGSGVYDDHKEQICFYSKAYTPDQPGMFKPAILHLKNTTKKGFQWIPVEYDHWVEQYELSYKKYVGRGYPLEPKKEIKLPRTITLNT